MSNHPLIDKLYSNVLTNLGLMDNEKLIIAGPCAVESYEQMKKIADELVKNDIKFLRAGAFKPRTSAYDFQGLELEGLNILKRIKNEYNLKIVSEIPSAEYLQEFIDVVDIIQVGARNMQNFYLLKALSKINKPVLLKRGFANTLEEWLCAAEYLLIGGNNQVILCERGIRTFETITRNTLDLGSVVTIKQHYHIPIIVDPSHACGNDKLVLPLSLASLVAGADGLIVEIHPNPKVSLSDSAQALSFDECDELIKTIKKLNKIVEQS